MPDSEPLVSIITPCYNYGKYLSETLECLLAQSYTNWECIIVNDGSKDNTEEIALKYASTDTRFRYIYQENTGLPGARNTALVQAKGKYVQLLDADDLIEKDKLYLQVELMEANTSISLVYSNILLFQSEAQNREYKTFILPNNVRPSGKNEIIISNLVNDTFFLPGCVIFRREVYEQVGKFNESLYGLEDWNYWFRAALLGFEFYSDDRVDTKLLCRDHEANMSKAYIKMLNARIQSRLHIMQVTELLKADQKLKVSSSFIDSILKEHKLLLLLDEYEYHFHFGSKFTGLKALIKYSFYSKKPFYIFERIKKFLIRERS